MMKLISCGIMILIRNAILTASAFVAVSSCGDAKWKFPSFIISDNNDNMMHGKSYVNSRLNLLSAKRIDQIVQESASEKDYNFISNKDNNKNDTSANLKHYSAVLNISYDGRNYHGWSSSNDDNSDKSLRQRRSKRRRGKYYGPSNTVKSIQGTLQKALSKLYGNVPLDGIIIEGCSRTDKGVHAKSYICTFECVINNQTKTILPFDGDVSKLAYVLNRMIPDDIRILGASYLPYVNFHPTVDAILKTYEYTLSIGTVHDPLTSRYTWDLSSSSYFNISKVAEASKILQGIHNFTAFQGAFRGSDRSKRYTVNPICNITQITIHTIDDDHSIKNIKTVPSFHSYHSIQTYKITITGTRFLYKMVRFIIGNLVSIGKGTISIDDVEYALNTGTRNDNILKYVECAPSHGLSLLDVQYYDHNDCNNCTSNDDLFTWCA